MEQQGIQVLSRAADILRALKADNRGLSLGRIARRVGLPRSTVQRIVNGAGGREARDAERRFRRLSAGTGGPGAGPGRPAGRLRARLRPVIETLSRDTGETVDLSVLRDGGMVFVDQVVGTQRLRTVSAIGEIFPLTVTANGKAALAWLDDGEVARIAADERRRLGTGRAPRDVMAEIGTVRDSGHALDLDEHTAGISAAGVAFRVRGAVYAISIPAPSQRFRSTRDALLEKLVELKAEIARVLPEAELQRRTDGGRGTRTNRPPRPRR